MILIPAVYCDVWGFIMSSNKLELASGVQDVVELFGLDSCNISRVTRVIVTLRLNRVVYRRHVKH